MDKVSSFFRQSLISYKGVYSYYELKVYLLTKVVGPLFQILLYVTVASFAMGSTKVEYLVIGNSMMLCTLNSISGVGSVLRTERNLGTLSAILVSSSNRLTMILSKTMIHIFDGLLNIIIGLTLGSMIFKLNFYNINFFLFSICLLITVYATTGLGLLIGSFGLILRDMNLLNNSIKHILLIFTGVNYSINILPKNLQIISQFLPMTRGIAAARQVFDGAKFLEIKSLLVGEVFVGTFYFLIGYMLIKVIEKKAIEKGTIDLY